MAYIVVTHWELPAFVDMVNRKMNEGYVPVGGVLYVSVGHNPNNGFHQAMMKR